MPVFTRWSGASGSVPAVLVLFNLGFEVCMHSRRPIRMRMLDRSNRTGFRMNSRVQLVIGGKVGPGSVGLTRSVVRRGGRLVVAR